MTEQDTELVRLTDDKLRDLVRQSARHGPVHWTFRCDDIASIVTELLDARSRLSLSASQGGEVVAWNPMNTVPRDGTEVLLLVKHRAGIPGKCLVGHFMAGGHSIEGHPPIEGGWYFWNGFEFDKPSEPIGWRPLYAAPPSPAVEPRVREPVSALVDQIDRELSELFEQPHDENRSLVTLLKNCREALSAIETTRIGE